MIIIWKSKMGLDRFRIEWKAGKFTASHYDQGEWVTSDIDTTAEDMVDWILSGDIHKDELIV